MEEFLMIVNVNSIVSWGFLVVDFFELVFLRNENKKYTNCFLGGSLFKSKVFCIKIGWIKENFRDPSIGIVFF